MGATSVDMWRARRHRSGRGAGLCAPRPPRFPFHPDPLEGLGRRQRPGAGDRAEACLGYGPTRRDPPDGARMTPADRTGAIREPAAGGRPRPTALPRPLGSLAPLRARIKVPILPGAGGDCQPDLNTADGEETIPDVPLESPSFVHGVDRIEGGL